MKHQLIVTFLGANRTGILSEIANLVCEHQCNILDSRQAIYGEDFSLTMILEGSQSGISKVEWDLPKLCQQLDLLSMMKRTRHHNKQHLVHLADAEFTGTDAVCKIAEIIGFFAKKGVRITAFRQDNGDNDEAPTCKMVVNMPQELSVNELASDYETLLTSYSLSGYLHEKH